MRRLFHYTSICLFLLGFAWMGIIFFMDTPLVAGPGDGVGWALVAVIPIILIFMTIGILRLLLPGQKNTPEKATARAYAAFVFNGFVAIILLFGFFVLVAGSRALSQVSGKSFATLMSDFVSDFHFPPKQKLRRTPHLRSHAQTRKPKVRSEDAVEPEE